MPNPPINPVALSTQGDSLRQSPRKGWAEAAQKIAAAGEDSLVMGEFPNAEDSAPDGYPEA
jgi:hypothetical protein